MLSLPEGQSPPNYNDLLKKEEMIQFCIERDKNLSLKVKEHEHKLLKSLTRSKWKCNVCKQDYESNQPTFLCSLCDYNMCDNCRKKGNYEEKISFPELIIPPNELIDGKFIESKNHEHRLVYCRHIHSIFEFSLWKCQKCKISFEKEIWSFSCTVCNCDFCLDCIFE
jgi:excinuclease UvrABC ATPase subunit